MPHGQSHGSHGHSHGENNEHGSKLITLSTIFGGVLDAIGSYYYISELVGLADGSDNSNSPYAQAMGGIAGVISLCSMYTHYQLYKYHQKPNPRHDEHECEEEHEPKEHAPPATSPKPSASMTPTTAPNTPLLSKHSETDHSDAKHAPLKSTDLTRGQKALLFGDWFIHGVGDAGLAAVAISKVIPGINRFGIWGKAGLHTASLVVSGVAAYGNVSSEADVFRKQNAKEATRTNSKTAEPTEGNRSLASMV